MKRKGQKILALFIAQVLCLNLLSGTALAAEVERTAINETVAAATEENPVSDPVDEEKGFPSLTEEEKNETKDDKKEEKPKWKPNKVVFTKDERGDIDPVQTDTTDSSYFFNNEDAISFNLGNNKKS